MTEKNKEYNYEKETIDHILRVQQLINRITNLANSRAIEHDYTKLQEPERSSYKEVTLKLKNLEYGSEEYRAQLREMKPAVEHHYSNNSHHPEYYENGIKGMSLVDLIEMVCDWKAASERHNTGDIMKSIDISKERFNMSDDLTCIIKNTIPMLTKLD